MLSRTTLLMACVVSFLCPLEYANVQLVRAHSEQESETMEEGTAKEVRVTATTDPETSVSEDPCPSSDLLERATECARGNKEFIQCVALGTQSLSRQCLCIWRHQEIQQCLGECLQKIKSQMCPPTDWKPADSKFLSYSGSLRPFEGIDGAYVINLKRRPYRLQQFLENSTLSRERIHVLEAYDGESLTWSDGISTLFGNNKFGSARGIIGTALSHFSLWRHIATIETQFHMVFEDDAKFLGGYEKLWNTQFINAMPLDADLIFLGGIINTNLRYHNESITPVNRLFARHKENNVFSHLIGNVQPNSSPSASFHYDAMGYILSSHGAKKLVRYVADSSFTHSVDLMLMKFMGEHPSTVYVTTPQIILPVQLKPELAFGGESDSKSQTEPLQQKDEL
eukprot:m.247400 g.247400  ORF g.247400 m.247400 type:complete len:396 (-) comp16126_c0_seq30:1354-2541(-)